LGFSPHSWIKAMTTCKKKSWRGWKGRRQTSMTQEYRSWFQDLINAGDYVEKWSYVKAIDSQCHFFQIKKIVHGQNLCIFTFQIRLIVVPFDGIHLNYFSLGSYS
jgi:hypothetical protein